MSATVPDTYVGLWQRRLLRTPATEDRTTRVYWLQTPSWHADLRIPIDRPALEGRAGFGALGEEDMLALARQQGFAGITEVEGDLCQWHRRFDYQPPSGFNDIGRMQFETPDRLLEYGVEQDYFEVWERVPGGDESRVLELDDGDGRPALQLSVGPWVMLVRPRPTTLGRATGLAACLAAAGTQDRAALLDFEISFGRRDRTGDIWRIELSTLPWLQGTRHTVRAGLSQ
jgi:hypothetical protein